MVQIEQSTNTESKEEEKEEKIETSSDEEEEEGESSDDSDVSGEGKYEENNEQKDARNKSRMAPKIIIDWELSSLSDINIETLSEFIMNTYEKVYERTLLPAVKSVDDYKGDILIACDLFKRYYQHSLEVSDHGLVFYDILFCFIINLMKIDKESREKEQRMSTKVKRGIFNPVNIDVLEDVILSFNDLKRCKLPLSIKPYDFLLSVMSYYLKTTIEEESPVIISLSSQILQGLFTRSSLEKLGEETSFDSCDSKKRNGVMKWQTTLMAASTPGNEFNQSLQKFWLQMFSPLGKRERHMQRDGSREADKENDLKIFDDYYKMNVKKETALTKLNKLKDRMNIILNKSLNELIADRNCDFYPYITLFNFFRELNHINPRDPKTQVKVDLMKVYVVTPCAAAIELEHLKDPFFMSVNPDIPYRPRIVLYRGDVYVFSTMDYGNEIIRIKCKDVIESIVVWCSIVKTEFACTLENTLKIDTLIKAVIP